jgi:hypothetical protein
MQGRPIERLELGEGPLVCHSDWRKQRKVYAHVIAGAVVLLRLHEGMAVVSPCVRRRRSTCGTASELGVSGMMSWWCCQGTCGCASWRQLARALRTRRHDWAYAECWIAVIGSTSAVMWCGGQETRHPK